MKCGGIHPNLILETGGRLNILGANTEDIGGSAYGQILVERPDEETVSVIKKYLDKIGVKYEEVEIESEDNNNGEVA